MKDTIRLFGTLSFKLCVIVLAAAVGFGMVACDSGTTSNGGGDDDILVSLENVVPNGSLSQTTTQLRLSFDVDIPLVAADIDLSGANVSKGTLSGAGKEYTLLIDVKASGLLRVMVSKDGYRVSGAKSVNVYLAAPGLPSVTFVGVSANGSETDTTSFLTLAFSEKIPGLSSSDITIDGGGPNLSKGALTGADNVYTLPIAGFVVDAATGKAELVVSVAKDGFTIAGASKTVTVYVYFPTWGEGEEVALQAVIPVTVGGRTVSLELIFDKEIRGLVSENIEFYDNLGGVSRGQLGVATPQADGTVKYTLSIYGDFEYGDTLKIRVDKGGYAVKVMVGSVVVENNKATNFISVTANGSETKNTTELTLTFSNQVVRIEPADLKFEPVMKAGDLKYEGNGVYTVPIYSFVDAGSYKVTPEKDGYTFTPASRYVDIYYASAVVDTLPKLIDEVAKLGEGDEVKVTVKGAITHAQIQTALANYANLKAKITIDLTGNNTKTIAANVFNDTPNLTGIVIPEDYTSVGAAFGGSGDTATKLESLIFYAKIDVPGSVFNGKTSLKSVKLGDGVTGIATSAFSGCTNLENVDLGNGLATNGIGQSAFSGCNEKLTTIVIPDSVKTIGVSAFSGCTKLANVTLGNGLTTAAGGIGNSAFNECTSLRTITLPAGEYTLGATSPFTGCTGLNTVYLYGPKDGTTAFAGLGIETLVIGNEVTAVLADAFQSCVRQNYIPYDTPSLTSITLGSGILTIGANAFENAAITSINIPNNVTSIGDSAFAGCEKVTSINLGYGLNDSGDGIGNNAFKGTKITSITLPAGNYPMAGTYTTSAFAECTELRTVVMNGPKDGTAAFAGDGATGPEYNDRGLDITSVTVASGVAVAEGAFKFCMALESVKLGIGLAAIEGSAFEGCVKLASISIPITVTNIGNDAFKASGLTSVVIPNSVAASGLGTGVFQGCEDLESVTLGTGISEIPENAFNGCEKLTAITLPKNVTSIGNTAFVGSEVSSLTINGSLLGFDPGAFTANTLKTLVLNADLDESAGTVTFPAGLTSITIGPDVTKDGIATVNFGELGGGPKNEKADLVLLGPATGTAQFANKANLKTITFGPLVKEIFNGAFAGSTSLESITIPNTIVTMGTGVFEGCTALKSVTIEAGIPGSTNPVRTSFPAIPLDTFKSCTELKEIVLPTSITAIGDTAFSSSGLKTLTLNGALATLGATPIPVPLDKLIINRTPGALALPNTLSLTIGAGVTLASTNVTAMIGTLETLDLNAPAAEGAYTLFDGTPGPNFTTIKKVNLGASFGATLTGASFASSNSTLEKFTVAAGNSEYKAVNDVLYNAAGTTLIKYPGAKLGQFVIPSTVTKIGASAFKGSAPFTSLVLGNGVTIEKNAFEGVTSFTAVVLGDNTTIAEAAFKDCTGGGGTLGIKGLTIGSGAKLAINSFNGCESLAIATFGGSFSIADTAFAGCTKLVNVELGASGTIAANTSFPQGTAAVPSGQQARTLKAAYELKDATTSEILGGAGAYNRVTNGQVWGKLE